MKRLARRKRRVCLCLLAAIAAFSLAGCWDRRELNDLAIAVGMGFDKQGDKIRITTQIVNPGEVASKTGNANYGTPVSTLSAAESTTFEALRKLTTVAPRRIFSSHLRMLVIGEEQARLGISKVIDGVSRNHEFRSDFYLIIAKGTTAERVLSILTPIEKIPANKLFKTLEMSEKVWAPTVKMKLDQFINELSDPTRQTVLTGLKIVGDPEEGEKTSNLSRTEPSTYLKYSGLALFKGDKLVDWMNDQESKGYNYIVENVQSTVGHLTCPDGGTLGVEIVHVKSKMKGYVKDGKPGIVLHIIAEENIGEVQCRIDLTKEETLKQLEETAARNLKDIVGDSIRKAQKNKADIFGFDQAIEIAEPKVWQRQLKSRWDELFATLPVTIHTEIHIRKLGTIRNSLYERKE